MPFNCTIQLKCFPHRGFPLELQGCLVHVLMFFICVCVYLAAGGC